MQTPLTAETLLAALADYDPNDAGAVSERIRQSASSDDLRVLAMPVVGPAATRALRWLSRR